MTSMQALILAGGSGTRFWPLSRRRRPKQLLSLSGERSLLRLTFERLAPLVDAASTWVCTTRQLAEAVRQQLPEVPAAQVLAEPEGRNTAPAIAWSICQMPEAARGEIVAVLPADHFMSDEESFRATLAAAAEVSARQGRIMTLGVRPTRPESGYGYLELGELLDDSLGLRRVRRFTEKPDAATAERFYASGDYLWNAGIFVFPGRVLLDRLAAHQPAIHEVLAALEETPARLAELYRRMPAVSIDHALMEKLDDLGNLPLDCGWSDLGSWEALWEQLEGDELGNVRRGSVVAVDSRDNLLIAEDGTVAVVGVDELVVVKAGEAVLVVPKQRSQEIRRLVEELERRGRDELL